MNGKEAHRIVLASVLVVGLAGSASADTAPADDESGWTLRFYAAAIDFDNSSSGRGPGGRGYDIDIGGALGINGEYRFSRHVGLDFGALAGGGVDIASRTTYLEGAVWEVHDTLSFTALTAGPDIHLTPGARVDFYICPMVALMQYGGLVIRSSGPTDVVTQVDFDEDFAVGASLGLGVPFGQRRWSFNTNLTYLDSSLDGTDERGLRLDENYDVTMFGFGFGYRF